MIRLARVLVSLAMLLCGHTPGLTQETLPLDAVERAWISAHPNLRVAVSAKHAPFEYMEGRALRGLSAEYIRVIAEKTGLVFTPVQVDNRPKREMLTLDQADVSFVVTHSGQQAPTASGVVIIPSRQSHPLLIVSRIGQPLISDPRQLNGRTVSVPDQWPFQSELQALAPEAKIVTGVRMFDVLSPVVEGTADAAIGSELLLLPYIHRRLEGRLQISGIYSERLAMMSAMVRSDQPILQSILQKAMASVTYDEAHKIYDNWLDFESLQIPSIQALTRHYPHEIALSMLVVFLLLGLMYQAHAQRRQANINEREKAKFLAVMSHEIRSPMNAVLAAVELLRHTELTAPQRHFAELANSGGRNLLQLLDDVLDMSKLEAGQVRLDTAPVNICALVRSATDLHRLHADEKGIALTVRTPADDAWLMLDETRVGQILHNLISNAIKFTALGGVEVVLDIEKHNGIQHKHEGRDRPGQAPTNTTTVLGPRLVVVTVADTGIGISEQALARLFQPYAQADNTYRRSGGTGLGLVISRELATLMNGTLSLTSTEGKGSVARLTMNADALPAPSGAAETASTPDVTDQRRLALPPPAPLGARVLIVEDVLANQEVLWAQLSTLGCQAVIAKDGTQALDCFNKEAFDLVLMDCDLPDQDGYTLTAHLRDLEQERGVKPVPIIAISASTDAQHVERCFDAGMDGVLSKPIQLGKLQDAIHLWCGVAPEDDTLPPPTEDLLDAQEVRKAMQTDLDNLLAANARNDEVAAARAAHRLRGAALVMRWNVLADRATALENLYRTKERDPLAHDVALKHLMSAWQANAN